MERSVTFCLCCFNDAQWIDQCIESILRIDYNQNLIKIIFCNDGSNDDTLKKIAFWQKKLSEEKLTIITRENKGSFYSRLECGMRVETTWMLFLDLDDTYFPECLKNIFDIKNVDDSDLVVSKFTRTVNNKKSPIDIFNFTNKKKFSNVIFHNGFSIWNLMIKTSFFQTIFNKLDFPNYKVILLDDHITTTLLFSNTKNITINEKINYHWNVRRGSTSYTITELSLLHSIPKAFNWCISNFFFLQNKKNYFELTKDNKIIVEYLIVNAFLILYWKTIHHKSKIKSEKKVIDRFWIEATATMLKTMKNYKINFPKNLHQYSVPYAIFGIKRKIFKYKK